jgi:hypothetical protein
MKARKRVTKSLVDCSAAVCVLTAAFALLPLVSTSPAWAVTQNEIQKLLASDGAASEQFGRVAAIDGNTAIVGAWKDDDNGAESGSAYVYTFDGTSWRETQKLTASDGDAGDFFGFSAAIYGDAAIVGAYLDDDNGTKSGSAYIYSFDGTLWRETQKLTASDGDAGDFFGLAVSIDDNTAIVGAKSDDDPYFGSGSAYIFTFNGTSWRETQKLTASDATAAGEFGQSVAIDGDKAIVGALDDQDRGSAYVFTFNGTRWRETQKLKASDAARDDIFGFSVAISDNKAIVGAPGDDDYGAFTGSAYIYAFDGTRWREKQKLTASDAAFGSFGISVAIKGSTVIIGARTDDDNGGNSGSAYLYTFDGSSWTETRKLLASDGTIGDDLGYTVAIGDDTAIVGAPGDDENGSSSGSAYVFQLPGLLPVDIDIRPFSRKNVIWPRWWGFVPVAILGSNDFDALQVDIPTVRFGPSGAEAIWWHPRARDTNRDGFSDLILLFKMRKTGIQCGDTSATLIGATFYGQVFTGTDSIRTVHCH